MANSLLSKFFCKKMIFSAFFLQNSENCSNFAVGNQNPQNNQKYYATYFPSAEWFIQSAPCL